MRRSWLIVGLLLATLISSTGAILAHAELISAFPEPGSTVASLTEIRLVFSEPIGSNARIDLMQAFVPQAELEPSVDPENPATLVAAVPPLPDGAYTVQWTVTSADGHRLSGSYSLGIHSAEAAPPWFVNPLALAGVLAGSMAAAMFIMRRWQPAASHTTKQTPPG